MARIDSKVIFVTNEWIEIIKKNINKIENHDSYLNIRKILEKTEFDFGEIILPLLFWKKYIPECEAEIKSGESGDNEFRYLVIEDSMVGMSFERRTDLNNSEIVIMSKVPYLDSL